MMSSSYTVPSLHFHCKPGWPTQWAFCIERSNEKGGGLAQLGSQGLLALFAQRDSSQTGGGGALVFFSGSGLVNFQSPGTCKKNPRHCNPSLRVISSDKTTTRESAAEPWCVSEQRHTLYLVKGGSAHITHRQGASCCRRLLREMTSERGCLLNMI